MKFDQFFFPKYNELTFLEKFILKTCCYFPPRQRRLRNELIISPKNNVDTLTHTFGNDFWKLIEGKRVLDFGCGEGGFVLGMACNNQCEVEGIDIQDNQEISNNYIKNNNILNAKFHVGSSEILPSNSYDIIISHDSFEHFEEPEFILNEMVRLTKPGGHILIKFGPTWMSPYGRHMGGTFKKSRPWIHLLIPERNMMRVHSVYHNSSILHDEYRNLKGGLNKMTIGKALRIIRSQKYLEIESMEITPWRGLGFLIRLPLLKELFGSGVFFRTKKKIIN